MTELARNLAGANLIVIWACVCIAVAVFTLMLYSIAAFRRTPAESTQTRGTTAEVLWAIVPIAIVIATAAPAVTALLFVDTGHNATEIARQQTPETTRELMPQKAFNEGAVPL